jgi:glycosyltransferase involved in cell wall biosynthesis
MPVYNAGDYLVEAIESILSQTYRNFEFIIVDDASTDSSLAIIKEYKNRYPKRIKVLHMEKTLNCGGDRCANEGLKVAKGKYIARMDADDIAHPKRLEKQVAYLEKNADVFLLGSNAYVINKEGEIVGNKLEPLTHERIYQSYCTFHPIIHPSVMLRRMVKNKSFTYEIKYSANNDYYTLFKLLCQGNRFSNLPHKLMYYRIHGKNDTFINMIEKFLYTLRIRFIMATRYGYRLTIRDIATSIAQAVILLILPEVTITKLYLLSKGIIKLKNPLSHITSLFPPYKLRAFLR